MKATQLIAKLQEAVAQHGDLEVGALAYEHGCAGDFLVKDAIKVDSSPHWLAEDSITEGQQLIRLTLDGYSYDKPY